MRKRKIVSFLSLSTAMSIGMGTFNYNLENADAEEVRAPVGVEIIERKEVLDTYGVIGDKEIFGPIKSEEIVIEEAEVVEEPIVETRVYNITSEEREMLASLIYLEARGESVECQKMILSTIFNRYDMGRGSLTDVVYAPNQFSPSGYIDSTMPTQTQYDVVDELCVSGSLLPSYVMYFRTDYHHEWSGYVGYTVVDNTYFGYNQGDMMN